MISSPLGNSQVSASSRAPPWRRPGPRPAPAAVRASAAAPAIMATAMVHWISQVQLLEDRRSGAPRPSAWRSPRPGRVCRRLGHRVTPNVPATVSAIAARQAKPCEPRAACGQSAGSLSPCAAPTDPPAAAAAAPARRPAWRPVGLRPRGSGAQVEPGRACRSAKRDAGGAVAAQRGQQLGLGRRAAARTRAITRPPSERRRTCSTSRPMSPRWVELAPRPGGRAERPRRRPRWRRRRSPASVTSRSL